MKNPIIQSSSRRCRKTLLHGALLLPALLLVATGLAQVNTGSDGHDGQFHPTVSTNINMADHPDGIYQYTSVNIPANVTVRFNGNANNTPVSWLVQGNVVISGTVDVSASQDSGPWNGPGGGLGGAGGQHDSSPMPRRGEGLGGGEAASSTAVNGGSASYASAGESGAGRATPGLTYGNKYLLPLNGGSGGGGAWPFAWQGQWYTVNGGGGGGAILIASDHAIALAGSLLANGGFGGGGNYQGGSGSGGGIRLLAPQITGQGTVSAVGGNGGGGDGYVRLDVLDDQFVGTLSGSASRGFNPILVAPANPNVSLTIQSLAGNVVPANPTGVLATPDVTIPAQQANPIPIVFHCANIPLNTPITVVVRPVNGPLVTATAMNATGTLDSSTGTVSLNLPRGGGAIYATAVVPVGGGQASTTNGRNARSFAQTGLTTDGERFTKIEITAGLGGRGEIACITSSGKRFSLPGN